MIPGKMQLIIPEISFENPSLLYDGATHWKRHDFESLILEKKQNVGRHPCHKNTLF